MKVKNIDERRILKTEKYRFSFIGCCGAGGGGGGGGGVV